MTGESPDREIIGAKRW